MNQPDFTGKTGYAKLQGLLCPPNMDFRLLVKSDTMPLTMNYYSMHIQHYGVIGGYIFMPRDLSEKDIGILKKLAPECGELTCSGSGHMFHSILPPVSNHFSEDTDDFIRRISRLSDEELRYIIDLIRKGEESLGCLPAEDVQEFSGLSMIVSPGRCTECYHRI